MAKIDNDEIRKKFEDRFKQSLFPLIKFDRTLRGTYANYTLQSMWEGFYACAEIFEKENSELKLELDTWMQSRLNSHNDVVTIKRKLAIATEALEEAQSGFNAIMSGLTTDITRVEALTKHRAHGHYVEVFNALAKIKDVK